MNDTDLNTAPEARFAASGGSAASSQYLARWLPEDGGKAVIVGDWHEVLTAATLFMEMGANKIEIETVRTMPPNDTAERPGPRDAQPNR